MMNHFSIFDLFTIGIGPSSSHTVGPMRAAHLFLDQVLASPRFREIATIRCDCYGSLAATGKGHGTDSAIILGLMGESPETVIPNKIPAKIEELNQSHVLDLGEGNQIEFIPERDIDLTHFNPLKMHPNGMHFSALNQAGEPIEDAIYYSTGGGFVSSEHELMYPEEGALVAYPYPYQSAQELLDMTDANSCSISDIVLANECMLATAEEVGAKLRFIWQTMQDSMNRGMSISGDLPGPLKVPRRAKKLRKLLVINGENQLRDPLSILDWVNLYAMAVSEENAAGGRVVTAPTNGAAGIIPAVLNYAVKFCESPYKDAVERFLLTAGGIAILYKKNASISGADVGCQGEVGVACSMAAAALTEYMGGSPHQVENAAEIGIEHNLGLTCDPIGGLVQIPCIERNAIAAIKALNAARIALRGTGRHFVPLDKAIRTMRDTGRDMQSKYKETAQGGLAVNVVNC
ncbi:MAG: L-serine ammonia-lyase [Akkermansia sp.]